MPRHLLSLAGGGFLGLFSAHFLELLEENGDPIGLRFDLLAGTSVGGLIALGLAAGRSAGEIRVAIEEAGPKIFPLDLPSRLSRLRFLWRPVFSTDRLECAIKAIVGDMKLADLKRPVVIPTVNMSDGRARLFRTPHTRIGRLDENRTLREVALATAAAPVYFAPHRIDGGVYADGGIIANAPDTIAVIEAIHHHRWSANDIRLLSVGTTYASPAIAAGWKRGWGVISWIRGLHLIKISLAAQVALSRRLAKDLLDEDRVLVADPEQSRDQASILGMANASEDSASTLKELAQSERRRLEQERPTDLYLFKTHQPANPAKWDT